MNEINIITTMCGNPVKVDAVTFEKFRKFNWRLNSQGQVVTSRIGSVREVSLRRMVLYGNERVFSNRRVYHLDGDPLNLTRENLSTTNVKIHYMGGVAYCTIPNGTQFIIDIDQVPFIKTRSWAVTKSGYISSVGDDSRREYLHRIVASPTSADVVDHINRDTLDNRKSNLRVCSHNENMRNRVADSCEGLTSIYKGVSKNAGGSYMARINRIRLGSYDSEIVAANVYNHHAIILFKDFARLNDVPFISEEECAKYRVIGKRRKGRKI